LFQDTPTTQPVAWVGAWVGAAVAVGAAVGVAVAVGAVVAVEGRVVAPVPELQAAATNVIVAITTANLL
jgi:hypothetical protein